MSFLSQKKIPCHINTKYYKSLSYKNTKEKNHCNNLDTIKRHKKRIRKEKKNFLY